MLSGQYFPYHPAPFEDELLSSWLLRLARGNGLKLHTFSSILFPKSSLWNIDIDKSAKPWMLEKLAGVTGTPLAAAKKTTLEKYLGYLYEKYVKCGVTYWILPVGSFHRLHLDFGLNYCPLCLQEDAIPYYRTIWRVGVLPVCIKHQCLLHDCCDRCRLPVNFNRSEFADRSLLSGNSVCNCYACGADFRKFETTAVPLEFMPFFRKIGLTLKRGWINIGEYKNVYSFHYFSVLRQLVRLFTLNRDHKRLVGLTGKMDAFEEPIFAKTVENIRTADRYKALTEIYPLLKRWPVIFIRKMRECSVTYSILMKDQITLPFWFAHPIETELKVQHQLLDDAQVEIAINYLKSKKLGVNYYSVKRVLGFTDSKVLMRYFKQMK